MADKQITELKKVSSLMGDDLFIVSQNGEAKSATASQIAKLAQVNGGSAAISLIYTILEKAVYTENVSNLLAQLKELLENGEPVEPEVTLVRISATYSGGSVPVGTAVSALTGIKVTAHYSDGSTAAVTDYTLSGTIKEGSNTVTVSYGGKTTTFTVVGEAVDTEADVSQVGKVLIVKSGVTVTKSGNVLNIA